MAKKVYCCIKNAIENGKLREPFNLDDVRSICKNKFEESTYSTFLNKHKVGNKETTELFNKDEENKTYTLLKPFVYDCQ